MTQVIIVFSDARFSSQLQAGLKNAYQLDVIIKNDHIEATAFLEIFPEIKLVVTQKEDASKICQYIVKNAEAAGSEINVLILGDRNLPYPNTFFIPVRTSLPNLIHQVGHILGLETYPTKDEVVEESDEELNKTTVFKMPEGLKSNDELEFVPFSIKYFFILQDIEIDFDVYTRVKKHDSFDYTLKLSRNTKVKKADLDKLAIRVGKELYVLASDADLANELLNKQFLLQYQKENLSFNERIQLNSDSYEILLDIFKHSSLNRHSIEIVKDMLKSLDIVMKVPDPMNAFFETLKNQNLSYGYIHAHLTCLIIFQIVDTFSWAKDQSKNKILYLSLFSELSLHNDRLIKLHHNFYKVQDKLTEEEKVIVMGHADNSALILEKIKAPKELVSIVREHHGLRHGKGFSESLSSGVSSLSMAFIVIEDFVACYLELWNQKNADAKEVAKNQLNILFAELKIKYDKLTYLDVVNGLQKYFNDRLK